MPSWRIQIVTAEAGERTGESHSRLKGGGVRDWRHFNVMEIRRVSDRSQCTSRSILLLGVCSSMLAQGRVRGVSSRLTATATGEQRPAALAQRPTVLTVGLGRIIFRLKVWVVEISERDGLRVGLAAAMLVRHDVWRGVSATRDRRCE